MMMPKLVCYDKNQWKTLQQLHNWNKEWRDLFSNAFYLTDLTISVECSWMDRLFVEELLGGVAKIPNIKCLKVNLSSKSGEVQEVLEAVEKSCIFSSFEHHFKPYC